MLRRIRGALQIALGCAAAASTPVAGQAQAALPLPLFSSHEPLEIALVTDLGSLRSDRREKDRPALLVLAGGTTLPVEVRPRGDLRRNPAVCSFPPLRLNVSAGGADGTPFAGQDKLKMVVPCHLDRDSFEELVLREYLLYRVYGLVTDLSYQVRLARHHHPGRSGPRRPCDTLGVLHRRRLRSGCPGRRRGRGSARGAGAPSGGAPPGRGRHHGPLPEPDRQHGLARCPGAQRDEPGAAGAVNADALLNGDGGEVVVFADDTARIYGAISAQGGVEGGNGGFVETSGKHYLDVTNAPDVSAPQGVAGEWLIDPYNLTIVSGTTGGDFVATDPIISISTDSTLVVGVIKTALGGGATVTIATGGTDTGDILWEANADLNYNSTGSGTLNLTAHGNIDIDGDIRDSNLGDGDSLNLDLTAGGDITIAGIIVTNGNYGR